MIDKQQLAAMGEHIREMGEHIREMGEHIREMGEHIREMGEHIREMEECKPQFKVPDGWKLVPVEITQEMYTIGGVEYEDPAKSWESGTFLTNGECAKAIYSAMLDAAPEYKP